MAGDVYEDVGAGSLRAHYEKSLEADRRECEEKLLALRIRKWQQGSILPEEEEFYPEKDLPMPAEAQDESPTVKSRLIDSEAAKSLERKYKAEVETSVFIAANTESTEAKFKETEVEALHGLKSKSPRIKARSAEVEIMTEDRLIDSPRSRKLAKETFPSDEPQGTEALTEKILDVSSDDESSQTVKHKFTFSFDFMPPRFINPTCDVETSEGSTVMFECSLMGIPSPVVSWFKGDKKIPHNNKKYLHSSDGDNHLLKIFKVSPQDSGVYTCRAINLVGETLCRACLVVLNAKTFSGKTRGRELTAVSLGSAKVQPQKFDLLVGNPSFDSEQMSEIELEFEFEQEIEFKGKSSDMCSFQFQVTEIPPKCIVPLMNVTAAVGTPVILQCLVKGKPTPTAAWYRDGDPITDSRNCIILTNPDGSGLLSIKSVKQGDSGLYTCKATNQFGEATCSAELLSMKHY
uniref:Ig-like domain-containing protein n=1 Tax=Oryzias latipes TaxID=8090 RepID=A0A3P9M6E6_ORYLA